jgi:hypothetical protein
MEKAYLKKLFHYNEITVRNINKDTGKTDKLRNAKDIRGNQRDVAIQKSLNKNISSMLS